MAKVHKKFITKLEIFYVPLVGLFVEFVLEEEEVELSLTVREEVVAFIVTAGTVGVSEELSVA